MCRVSSYIYTTSKITINVILIHTDTPLVNVECRILVPIRAMFKALVETVE